MLTETAAITEHQKQSDTIRSLQTILTQQGAEMDQMRNEMRSMRAENDRLARCGPSDSYVADPYQRSRAELVRPELPPLRSIQSGGPDSMTGVQYEPARVNGFRPTEGPRF